MEWSDDSDSKCIFWLNGMAGTSKSTISRTVASHLDEKKRLAASFFFSRDQEQISHANMFFTTIAAQLADRLPMLRPSISKAIKDDPDIVKKSLREQWQKLILEPLKNAPAQSIQLVIIIDALDECECKEDIQLILLLLAQAKQLETIRLRIFVTSRPEIPIMLGFGKLPDDTHQDLVLHDIPLEIVNIDISVFFQHKLSEVKKEHGLGTPWPDESDIQRLVDRASGLFIFAATACRFIREDDFPEEQLSLVLGENVIKQSSTTYLDNMYTKILGQAFVSNQSLSILERSLE